MSGDGTYRKFRDANDSGGNMAWAAKMARKALVQDANAGGAAIEEPYEMSIEEKIIWRLLKVPRKYMDLENLGVLSAETIRGVVRGLVAAEVVEIKDLDAAKPIVPLEVKRHRAKLEGKDTRKTSSKRSKLKARVYRPDIGGGSAPAPPPSATRPKPTPMPVEAPKAIEAVAVTRETLSAEGKAVVDLIERLAEKAKSQDWYGFLGVPHNADAAAVKKGYMNRARELHPDRVTSSGASAIEEIRKQGDELFKKLQNAYGTLSDEKKRAFYDADLADGKVGDGEGGKVRRPEEARLMMKKGRHLLNAKQYDQAHQQLRMAIDFDKELTEARVWAAWALYYHEGKDPKERADDAKKQLRDLVRNKEEAEAAYRLALIARMEGESQEHEKRIRQCLRLSPNHREALQEKRVLERRRQASGGNKDEKKGGLLSRFKK